VRLHPSLSNLFRSKIRHLPFALQDPNLHTEATEALRVLVFEIRMVPHNGAPNGHHFGLAGELAGILALGSVTIVAGA
jgi:hypothetical protein